MAEPNKKLQCVYTIVNRDSVVAAMANGGSGTFLENKSWTSARAHWLQSVEADQPYLLLLGDAATTRGVEWVARIAEIEPAGPGSTQVAFEGLRPLADVMPLSRLRKSSDGKPLSASYIRPYVPCWISGQSSSSVLDALASAESSAQDVAGAALLGKTQADYAAVLRIIEPKLTAAQRAMLLGHAQAPDHALDMQSIAELGGYASFRNANAQYGRLGRWVADQFGISGLVNQTSALAEGHEDGPDGEFQWVLREPLVAALEQLGWISVGSSDELSDLTRRVAAEEIDADPGCLDIPATTRTALVEARIGQGVYRAGLMALWESQCALTGCVLPQVLVASHAKPWRLSSNKERLDAYNGLLLAAHVDRLFDSGLISFNDDGHMLAKPEVTDSVLASLGLTPASRLRFVKARHRPYLRQHRLHHGFTR